MNRIIATIGAVLLLLSGTMAAQADVIDQWSYQLDGVFTYWKSDTGAEWHYGQGNNNTGITGDNTATLRYHYLGGVPTPGGSQGGAHSLQWGGAGEYSSIHLLPSAEGTVFTDGPAAAGLDLQHENRSISTAFPALSQGTALLTLALSPSAALLNPTIFATTFDFFFIETPNEGPFWDDVFVVENPLVSATEQFTIDGVTYEFSFAASFDLITGHYADVARETFGWGSDHAVYGWVTAENDTTTFPTQFTIKQVPVPEPATMALLGIGLAGLGALARRRRRA